MLGVSSITNPTDSDFVHEFAGQRILIGSGQTVQLPESAAKDAAYHLAQRVLKSKGLPFFGAEHDSCISQLLGTEEPTFFGEETVTGTELPETPAEDPSEPGSEAPVKKQAPRGFMKNKAK